MKRKKGGRKQKNYLLSLRRAGATKKRSSTASSVGAKILKDEEGRTGLTTHKFGKKTLLTKKKGGRYSNPRRNNVRKKI